MVVGWYHSHPGFGCWLSGVDINTQQVFIGCTCSGSIYPWFKFYFPLFWSMVMYDMIMSEKQREIKFKPRIKLNHNIHIKLACSKQNKTKNYFNIDVAKVTLCIIVFYLPHIA